MPGMKLLRHGAGIGNANRSRKQTVGADNTGFETSVRGQVEVDPLRNTMNTAIGAARTVNSDGRRADTAKRAFKLALYRTEMRKMRLQLPPDIRAAVVLNTKGNALPPGMRDV